MTYDELLAAAEASPKKCKNWVWKAQGYAMCVSLPRGLAYVEYYRPEAYDDDDLSSTGWQIPPRSGKTRVLHTAPLADRTAIRKMVATARIPIEI